MKHQLDPSQGEEFVCQLCDNIVGHGPMITKCLHVFCGDCWCQWFGDKRHGRGKAAATPCPSCKNSLRDYDVCGLTHDKHKNQYRKLLTTPLLCRWHPDLPGSPRTCKWFGTYVEYPALLPRCKGWKHWRKEQKGLKRSKCKTLPFLPRSLVNVFEISRCRGRVLQLISWV